jgi:hypothetical protein
LGDSKMSVLIFKQGSITPRFASQRRSEWK